MHKFVRMLTIPLTAATILFATEGLSWGATTNTNNLSYEFDNGTTWTLAKNTAALKTAFASTGYADVGVVVDLGPASEFDGLTWEGTGPLAANIWLGDGSEAYTPGTHNLSDAVDFSYGPWGGVFWTGPQAGHSVDTATISGLTGDPEVYAWVGVVFTGASVSGSVTSVDGHSIGNRTMSLTLNADSTVSASIK